MKQQNGSLLKLIKLQEGFLSDADGAVLREQLATNPTLLQQWKKLSAVYNNREPLENEPLIEEVDAELIARYVDQNLRGPQLADFESLCWKTPAIIRELIAAVKATHAESSCDIPREFKPHAEKAGRRMLDFVNQQCATPDASPDRFRYLQKIESPPQTETDSFLENADADETEHEQVVLQRLPEIQRSKTKRRSKKKKQRQQHWVILAAAIVIIAVTLPLYFNTNRLDNSQTVSIIEQRESNNEISSPSEPELASENSLTNRSERNEQENIAQKPPEEMKQQDAKETAIVKQKDEPKSLPEKQQLHITWASISGIAGYRPADSTQWKGILSQNSEKRNHSETEKITFRTLPASWLRGETGTGAEIVVDANTEVQIAVYATNSQTEKTELEGKNNATETAFELELHNGRIALSQLSEGDLLKIKSGQATWNIRATREKTSLGLIQRENNVQELVAFSGGIVTTSGSAKKSVSLKSSQAVLLTDNGIQKPSRTNANQRWRNKPPQKLQLSQSLIEQVNKSNNLLAALYSAPAAVAAEDRILSRRLAFALDPVATVPRAAVSKVETDRIAAIEWLLAAPGNETVEAVWDKIALAGNGKQSALSVRTWFEAAQGKIPATPNLLAELSNGLAAKEPLFVRECSIYFLRQITRQPLTEYDPNKPTQAAIASVRKKARRATGQSRRRR